MLTRLEVKGFKNLIDLTVDFGPFTCIAGPNGVGKSNVFDAIEFLSLLATETLPEASRKVRDIADGRIGDPRDLFWDGYHGDEHRMTLCAEMIVPSEVTDDFGASAQATTTFLRYEVSLGYTKASDEASVGRLTLLSERLVHITRGEAPKHLRFKHSKARFRDRVVLGERRGGPFISTDTSTDSVIINVHGDGGSRGRPQPRPALGAGRTIVSTVVTVDQPTILAARQEMQSWRRLALEPSALRTPNSFSDARVLGADGSHLAGTLYRVTQHAGEGSGPATEAATYARIAGRLADLADLGVDTLEVEPDPVRESLTLFLHERSGLRLPARALSEGTLRFLALCVLLEDPTVGGLICMEEPENGIHPANLEAMIQLVRELAVDPQQEPAEANPFRQVIVNTHSPGVVTLCSGEDVLLAETRPQVAPNGHIVKALALLPLAGTWRSADARPVAHISDLLPYVTAPPGRQLRLPEDLEHTG
ncbi:MAG TPA: AAA family ATPase [Aldersonia sp.]